MSNSTFWQRPSTRLGWWSIDLAVVFVVMFIINSAVFMQLAQTGANAWNAWWQQTILPFYGIFMLLFGVAASVIGLMAVVRKHERSWLVWLTILPGAFTLFLVLGELLVPH